MIVNVASVKTSCRSLCYIEIIIGIWTEHCDWSASGSAMADPALSWTIYKIFLTRFKWQLFTWPLWNTNTRPEPSAVSPHVKRVPKIVWITGWTSAIIFRRMWCGTSFEKSTLPVNLVSDLLLEIACTLGTSHQNFTASIVKSAVATGRAQQTRCGKKK